MLSDPLSSDDEGLGEEVGQFVKGSAIGQSKRIEKRRQRYGDAQAEAERRRLMGRRHADSSGAGPDGDGQPAVSTSIFYALLIAATIVGYSLTDSVGTQQCPAALYLLGMILVQCLCWLPWVLCSPKLRGDVARALSPRSVGGFRVETCFFGVCAPGTCKSRSSLSERLASLKPRNLRRSGCALDYLAVASQHRHDRRNPRILGGGRSGARSMRAQGADGAEQGGGPGADHGGLGND